MFREWLFKKAFGKLIKLTPIVVSNDKIMLDIICEKSECSVYLTKNDINNLLKDLIRVRAQLDNINPNIVHTGFLEGERNGQENQASR